MQQGSGGRKTVDSQFLLPALGSVCQLPWLHKVLCTRQVMPSGDASELCGAACFTGGYFQDCQPSTAQWWGSEGYVWRWTPDAGTECRHAGALACGISL